MIRSTALAATVAFYAAGCIAAHDDSADEEVTGAAQDGASICAMAHASELPDSCKVPEECTVTQCATVACVAGKCVLVPREEGNTCFAMDASYIGVCRSCDCARPISRPED